ncbi:uncharacterized protein LOC9647291 isoform X3 [Selaginella moellendorffii]|uniref:uncharacterized protein LOC9647291 isoform X3 n=1 Tax=Selaginella moellendorffii TaxID=88036 RepID=UPI000D1C4FD1|nr:uncharacterized protein LOC9647291 isoform X3 [Selaginella moellendorffii]|eukprot:XP_024519658.1 uncharacterized protein LOC9647291 isoform X3 [Selaginella moellendorffii]
MASSFGGPSQAAHGGRASFAVCGDCSLDQGRRQVSKPSPKIRACACQGIGCVSADQSPHWPGAGGKSFVQRADAGHNLRVDFLTSNNYPEGDCCFCLFPLVDPALDHAHQHYMKLMSCFHCFHSDCFSDWWKWLPADSTASCPVCRAEIHTQDVAHVKEICSRGSTVGVETRGEPDETAVAVVLCEQMPEVSHSTVSTSSDSSEWAQLPVYDTHASHRNKKKHSAHAAKRQWLRKQSGEEFR